MRSWKPFASIAAAAWTAPAITPNMLPRKGFLAGTREKVIAGVAAALVVGVAAVFELSRMDQLDPLALVMIAFMVSVPLVVVLVSPLTTWRALTIGLFASALLVPSETNTWPWPISAFVAYLAVSFWSAMNVERKALFGLAFLGCILPVLPSGPQNRMPDGIIFILFGLVILVISLGGAIRANRATQSALDAEIENSRAELVRSTILEERTQLARELHDVVAHHMSLIAIQADVIPRAVPGLPQEAVDGFASIRHESKTALSEMRRLVDALRDNDSGSERAPQPTLDEVARLVDAVRATGGEASFELVGDPAGVPAPVAVSAYRIVQEALANAVQHSPGGSIAVAVRRGATSVEVRVVNTAPTRLASAPTVEAEGTASRRVGHGLIGMRERANLLGGTIEIGPLPDGGFAVHAHLPLARPDDAS